MTEPSAQEPSEVPDADAVETGLVAKGSGSSPMPFENLSAPTPTNAAPPAPARWLAFAGILLGGLLGGFIGYGIASILSSSSTIAALGALIAGVACAIGVGIIASLTLQAMNEWNVSAHPEDPRQSNR